MRETGDPIDKRSSAETTLSARSDNLCEGRRRGIVVEVMAARSKAVGSILRSKSVQMQTRVLPSSSCAHDYYFTDKQIGEEP